MATTSQTEDDDVQGTTTHETMTSWGGTPLILGAGLSLEPRDDGVYIRIVIADRADVEAARADDAEIGHLCETGTPETWDPLFQKVVKRDFYKTQKYKEIANILDDRAPEYIDGGHLAGAFRSRCEALEAHEEEVQETLRSPTVNRILDETKKVEYRRIGDDSAVSITLEHDGERATIDFSPDEWVKSDGTEFIVRYFTQYFEKPEINGDDWEVLMEVWEAQAVDAGGDDYSALDAVGEEIVTNLQRRLDVYDERDALQHGAYSGWYEETPGNRLHSLPDDAEPLVWVRSLAFVKELKGAGRSHDDVSALIDHFTDEGIIRTEQKNIDNKRVYGCSPGSDGLDISPGDVTRLLDEDWAENGHGVGL